MFSESRLQSFELYPRVGFIVTNMSPERVIAFYNKRGTCEQWIKEGKGAIKWTRLSCRTFAATLRTATAISGPFGSTTATRSRRPIPIARSVWPVLSMC
jgi:hypothetical protein